EQWCRTRKEVRMTSIEDIKVSDVVCPPKGTRKIIKEKVEQFAGSMKETGLLHPIRVRRLAGDENGKMELLTGQHRYQAAVLLKWTTIPAIICDADDLHAELIQIDENLCRADLSPAEEAAAAARRKEIYEELHPATTHGGDRKSSRQNGDLKGK